MYFFKRSYLVFSLSLCLCVSLSLSLCLSVSPGSDSVYLCRSPEEVQTAFARIDGQFNGLGQVHYSTIHTAAMLCYAMLCYAMLCYAMLYAMRPNICYEYI